MDEHAEQHDLASGKRSLRRNAPIAALVLLGSIWLGTYLIESAGSAAPGSTAPATTLQVLDLKEFYITTAPNFTNGRFPWGAVPRGAKTFGNIPLAIDGMICLWGASNAKMGLVFPEQIDDIGVNRKFETLYVYHTAFFQSPEGSPVYRLTLHYADGSLRECTLCYGMHLVDWYEGSNERLSGLSDPKSQIVWRGDPPKNTAGKPKKLRFCLTSIPNPKPSLEVKSISLASAKGNSAGCILAMTTGPADLLVVVQ